MMDFAIEVPTVDELLRAHEIYADKELRGTDEYWEALKGTERGFSDNNISAAAKAIAILLKSWNKNHYRFKPEKKARLEADLEDLGIAYRPVLDGFRARSIITARRQDRASILSVFTAFESKLGPVGSAKALNLIAPSFFPLWDNPISYHYGVGLCAYGYIMFMLISRFQVGKLDGALRDDLPPLKVIDEFNYCKFTKGWIS